MPTKYSPEAIEFCFGLFLRYNGENFDRIEQDMRAAGWLGFTKQLLFSRGLEQHRRDGWIEKFGWKAALEIHLANKSKQLLSRREKTLLEVETIRERIYEQITARGVDNRDLVWQHDKYSERSARLLAELELARQSSSDFAAFWKFLLTTALAVSPQLARELVNAEDAILHRAKQEFSK